MDRKPARRPRTAKSDVLRLVAVGVIFAAVAVTLKQPYFRDRLFDIETLRKNFQDKGLDGIILFISTAAIINALGIPRLWISAGAGTLYGAFIGAMVAQVATLLGATLNFLAGRSLLRGPVKRRMPARMRVWYDRFNANGFRWILYIRLFPFSNATLTNLMCGVSRVTFGTFLAATFLGYLPFTIIFSMLGSSAAKQSWLQMVAGLVLCSLVFVIQWIYRKSTNAKEVEETEDLLDENSGLADNRSE